MDKDSEDGQGNSSNVVNTKSLRPFLLPPKFTMISQYILRLFLFVMVLMVMVSCASMVSYRKAKESLKNAHSCCESIAQFQYEPLAEEEGIKFKLDASSPAFDFETGKSYFKAFRLPEKALPYRIKITSYALGTHINNSHIFYPQVDLLDDHFSIIEYSDPKAFRLSKAGFNETLTETGGLPVKLEGTVLVDNPAAKYVLVFTTEGLMASTSPYLTRKVIPILLPGIATAVPGTRGAHWDQSFTIWSVTYKH